MPTNEETAAPSPQPVDDAPPAPAPPGDGATSSADSAPGDGDDAAQAAPSLKDIGRFAERRRNLSARERAIKDDRRALSAERTRYAEERKASDERIAKLERQLAEVTSGNPLMRPGVDPEKAVREFVAQGTPEAKQLELEKRLEQADAARAALEKRIEEAEKKREEERGAQTRAQAEAQEQAALRNFASVATSGEAVKKYPHLNAEFTPAEVLAKAREVHEWAKTQKWKDPQGKVHTGASYSFEEVANFLESQAKQVHKMREDRRKAVLGSPEPPATAPRANAPPGNGRRVPGQPPRVEGPTVKPHVRARMTREQEAAEDLAALRKATAADAAAKARQAKPAH